MIEENYYCSGTDFEVINCPAFGNTRRCTAEGENHLDKCQDVKNCIIKNHIVALSALVDVAMRSPGSAECIGAKACFDSFLVNKPVENQ